MKTIQRIHRLPMLGNKSRWVFRVVNEDKTYFMLIQQWSEFCQSLPGSDSGLCTICNFNICDEFGNVDPESLTVDLPVRYGWIDEMQSRGYKVLADIEYTPEYIS